MRKEQKRFTPMDIRENAHWGSACGISRRRARVLVVASPQTRISYNNHRIRLAVVSVKKKTGKWRGNHE